MASALDENEEIDVKDLDLPYMKFKPLKEYTLCLDLDETLIHFRVDTLNENKGILRIRPGLSEFLKEMSSLYEIVIFTASTKDVIILSIN